MGRLELGTVVQGLRVESELGRGAFGSVYLAEDELLGRRVALKVLEATDPSMHGRGLREARVVARVRSPHIVMLYRVHALDDQQGWLLEMEYIGGGSLKDVLDQDERVPVPRAVEITRGILSALHDAHEAGVVHGDVKPGNVLLEPTGAVKLADFGLSWLIDDASMSVVGDGPAGTPVYMAPEIIMGEQNRAPSDLWSVGVILHRMLSGRMPFRVGHLQQLFLSVLNGDPAPLPASAPVALHKLVAELLTKDPAARPTAAQALALLDGVETAPAAAPAPTKPASAGPTLFGRDEETATLSALLDATAAGTGAALLLTGDAGSGKSALTRWLLAQAGARGMGSVEVVVSALEGALGPLLRGARHAAPADLAVPGLPEQLVREMLDGGGEQPLGSRQQIAWAVAEIFAAIGRDRPLVVAVENVHEADAEDVRLLRELMRRLADAGVLIAVTFRTHDIDSSAAGQRVANLHQIASLAGLATVDLAPLPPTAIHALLEQQTHAAYIEPSVVQRLVALAEGNPLLAVEMMRHLEAEGSVVADGSAIRPTAEWADARLPGRFREIVARRLAGLSEEQRALLDAAAVDGREFDGEALEAVLERPLLDVLREVQRLYRERHLFEPHGDGFRFTSKVVHEVVYDEIAPAFRRAIHRRLAEHLEKRGDGVDPMRLGVHWERGGGGDRAVPYLMAAAAEAARRQEKLRLVDLCERAGVRTGAEYLPTLLRLAAAYRDLGRADEMDKLYEELLDDAADDATKHRVRVQRSLSHCVTRGVGSVDRVDVNRAAEALPLCVELGDAKFVLGLMDKVEGKLQSAVTHFRAAHADFVSLDNMARQADAVTQLGGLALREERYGDAEEHFREAVRISDEVGRPVAAAVNRINRAVAVFGGGEVDGLEGDVEAAVRTITMAGTGPVPAATVFLARLLYAQGKLPQAHARVDVAVDLLRRYNDVGSIETVRTEEAHIAAVQGLLPRARSALAAANEAADKQGHLLGRVTLAALEAQVLCMAGDIDGGRAAAERTVQLASEAEEAGSPYDWLAEAVLYGLPVACLPECDDPFVRAARAYATGVVAELPQRLPGRRQATLRLVVELFAADDASLKSTVEKARALGHVWLEVVALKRFHKRTGSPDALKRRNAILDRIAEGLPENERARFDAVWR